MWFRLRRHAENVGGRTVEDNGLAFAIEFKALAGGLARLVEHKYKNRRRKALRSRKTFSLVTPYMSQRMEKTPR